MPASIKTVVELRERILSGSLRNSSHVPWLIKKLYNQNVGISFFCPDKSKRNPLHLNGYIHHVIEAGSFYYIIEPLVDGAQAIYDLYMQPPRAYLYHKFNLNQSEGFVTNLKVISDQRNYEDLLQALRKYVCLLPASAGISYSNPRYTPYIILDQCTFVPYEVAYSNSCGGLFLFNNTLNQFRHGGNLCNSKFGECIGRPLNSLFRFPIIPTFGLSKLTGWRFCSSHNFHYLCGNQQHPVGLIFFPNYHVNRTYPRALLQYRIVSLPNENQLMAYRSIQLSFSSPQKITTVLLRFDSHFSPLKPKVDSNNCSKIWNLQYFPFSYTATLTAVFYNSGEGGGDVTLKANCSELLQIQFPFSKSVKQWIKPKSTVQAKFVLFAKPSSFLKKSWHQCNMTIKIPSFETDINLSCSMNEIYTYYGFFLNPCTKKVQLSKVYLMYFVLLPSHESSIEFMQQNREFSYKDYTLTRGIAITTKESKLMTIKSQSHSILINCSNSHIRLLSSDNMNESKIEKNHIMFNIEKQTKTVFFLSKKGTTNTPSMCSMKQIVKQPNGYCVQSKLVVNEFLIPLKHTDVNAWDSIKDHSNSILLLIYGWQKKEVYCFMFVCILLSFTLSLLIVIGHTCKCYFRSKFPIHALLCHHIKKYKEVTSEDINYWENPNSFLKLNSLGAHFVLFNYKSTQPINVDELSTLKVCGALKYKDKELDVVVGNIQHLFMEKEGKNSAVWLTTSSGVYLLQFENCANEYRQTMYNLLKKNGMNIS